MDFTYDRLPFYNVYFKHEDSPHWTLYCGADTATEARNIAMMLHRLHYPVYIHDYIWKHKTPTYIDGTSPIID